MTTTYYIVADMSRAVESRGMKESGSSFECPEYMVLVGRSHRGDENGTTYYRSAYIVVDQNVKGESPQIELIDHKWESAGKQSRLDYKAPDGWVITGRSHKGDENGVTNFRISRVKIDNTLAQTVNEVTSDSMNENSTHYDTPAIGNLKSCLTGMSHSGDENGQSTYTSRLLFFSA